MDKDTRAELPLHVSIPIDPEPISVSESSPATPPLPPPTNRTPLTTPPSTSPSTMQRHKVYDNSVYPRAAESDSEATDSEDSLSLQMEREEERPPPSQDHPHIPPPHPSHPHPPLHTTHHTPSSWGHQESLSEDLICTICASLLHDPMSLHCGHSFCTLCLAGMWRNAGEPASATSLQCPVCRAPWRNFPGVNIQLRNIIQRSYPLDSQSRMSAVSPEDETLLEKFKQARGNEAQFKDKVHINLRQEEIRRLVSLLCFFFLIIIAFLVLVFCFIFWVWTGAGGEFMRKPASQWSREDVAEWVTGLGDWATKNYSTLFLSEHINGHRLLQLDEVALEAIGVKNVYRRHSILLAIEELKETEFSAPRNFQEFKAAHRKQTLLMALFYTSWPRFTLLYAYYFNYYNVFLPFMRFHFPSKVVLEPEDGRVGGGEKEVKEKGEAESWGGGGEEGVREREEVVVAESLAVSDETSQPYDQVLLQPPSWRELIAMFIELLLIPHFLVALYAWSWAGKHPWITIPIIAHCLWQTWVEGKLVVATLWSNGWTNFQLANWRAKLPRLLKVLARHTVKQYFSFIFLFFVATMVWHIVPHFLCDILFYFLIWQTVIFNFFLSSLLRCLPNRNFRAQFQMNVNAP